MGKDLTKAELLEQIEALKAQVAALQNNSAVSPAQPVVEQPVQPQYTPIVNTQNVSNDVTVVYCSDSLGFAKISNLELHFNKYGEEFLLNRYQFDELVGKYHSWFDRGILAVSNRNADVAIAKGLPTDKEFILNAKELEAMGTMTCAQLEKFWNKQKYDEHRVSIVTYYKRKFMEDAPGYRDRAKIDLLNRLTGSGFERESDELSGRYKISQTDMND